MKKNDILFFDSCIFIAYGEYPTFNKIHKYCQKILNNVKYQKKSSKRIKKEVEKVMNRRKKEIFSFINMLIRQEINLLDLYNMEYISKLLTEIFKTPVTPSDLSLRTPFINFINEIQKNPQEYLDAMIFIHNHILHQIQDGFRKISDLIHNYENLILKGALYSCISNEDDAKILTDIIEWIEETKNFSFFVTNDFCDIYNNRGPIYTIIKNNKKVPEFPFTIKNIYQV